MDDQARLDSIEANLDHTKDVEGGGCKVRVAMKWTGGAAPLWLCQCHLCYAIIGKG